MSTTPISLASLEQQLTTAIGQDETSGGTAGVGSSLNNPGAIESGSFASSYGATSGGRFANFPSLGAGWQALTGLVDKYIQSGASLSSMMSAYAPTSENPSTPSRIANMATLTGLDPNKSIISQVTPLPASNQQASNPSGNPLVAAVQDAVNPSASSQALASTSLGNGLTISRVATFIVGFLLLIIGLVSLRQAQSVIESVGKVSEIAAV